MNWNCGLLFVSWIKNLCWQPKLLDRLEFCRFVFKHLFFSHIGLRVWTFARFVRPLLTVILCVCEIWYGSNNTNNNNKDLYRAHIHPAGCSRRGNRKKHEYKQFTVIAKTHIMYRDTCTMQLQIYIFFEKLWHTMSFKQRLKSRYTMTRFEFSWKMIPESRSRDGKRPPPRSVLKLVPLGVT